MREVLRQLFEEYPPCYTNEPADRHWILDDLLARDLYNTALVAARRLSVPPDRIEAIQALLG